MGILDFFKKAISTTNNVEEKNSTNNNENINGKHNNSSLEYKKGKYNKEQAVALFLRSTSYNPKKVGKTNDDYPRYLYYDCNILDIPKFHHELIGCGYFIKASFEEVINDFKVNELKTMLVDRQQDVKGLKKEEMIKIITDIFSDDEKRKLVDEQNLYKVSQLGLDYLEKHKEFLTVVCDFKKYFVSYDEYLKYKEELSPDLTVRDIVWHVLNEKILYYSTSKDFGLLRNVYSSMARFLEEEKPSAEMLFNYIMVLYYDINLVCNQKLMLENIDDKKFLLECIIGEPLVPGVISKIKEYSNYHNEEIFDKVFECDILPFKFIKEEDFKGMVYDIYNSELFDEEKYTKLIVENAKNIINEM